MIVSFGGGGIYNSGRITLCKRPKKKPRTGVRDEEDELNQKFNARTRTLKQRQLKINSFNCDSQCTEKKQASTWQYKNYRHKNCQLRKWSVIIKI